MKKLSQVVGLPLIGIEEGVECGVVDDILVDPETRQVKSVLLHMPNNDYDFRELFLRDIIGIGKDYVITQSVENAKRMNMANMGMTLKNVKCIASSGDVLGVIDNYEFEEKTGQIVTLSLNPELEVDGKSIRSLSNNLVFIDQQGKPFAFKDNSSVFENENSSATLENEQKDFMLGRTVTADITNDYGEIVIEKGTTVTEDVIRSAADAGVTIDLTLNLD